MCVCVSVSVSVSVSVYDWICQKDLLHAIVNIEKSHFEILITVYLENAWCLMIYAVLHQSIVIQGISVGVLLNGLLAELPAIL